VGDPLNEQAETLAALRQVLDAAGPYLDGLPDRLVYDRTAEPLLGELDGPLPERGSGTSAAVGTLLRVGTATATASAGPRFYHFVIGGSTPAALAADWVVSMLDQNAFVRASSRFADTVETVTLDWLRQLVGLPTGWGGALTASATFANLTGLALATHWWAQRHGVDVTSAGLAGLPRMPVLSGGYVHPSARKALQMLGHGRDTVEVFARDDIGRHSTRSTDGWAKRCSTTVGCSPARPSTVDAWRCARRSATGAPPPLTSTCSWTSSGNSAPAPPAGRQPDTRCTSAGPSVGAKSRTTGARPEGSAHRDAWLAAGPGGPRPTTP
jgi:hypothetical protein